MNPTNNNNQNAIVSQLQLSQQNPGAQTAQALKLIMQDPTLAKAYNDRASFYNATNKDAANGIINGPSNPINGYAVNPSSSFASFADTVPANQAMTNGFLATLVQQAQSGTNNARDNVTGMVNANANKLTAQTGAGNSGWTSDANGNITNNSSSGSSANGTGNQRIDNYVKSILNGYSDISKVPADISPRVMSELSQRGYDPAKELWNDLGNLQGTYSQGGGLATGNNYAAKANMGIGDVLNFIGIKTGQEQQKQIYIDASKNFVNKYGGLLGKNISLPTVDDTTEQAAKKFNQLTQTIRAKFYNGGQSPSVSGSNNDPLGLGLK